MGLAIEADGLVKRYGELRALDGIDLAVRRGEVFGFLGPSGEGQTTAIRILATLTQPDCGGAHVLGYDVISEADEVRARVALTGQLASLDEDLTGYENLLLLGRLRFKGLMASLAFPGSVVGRAQRHPGGLSGRPRPRMTASQERRGRA